MASGIGYAVLPATVKLENVSKDLNKQIEGPAKSAGQRAASVLGGALKVGLLAAGTAAMAGLGVAMKGGWDRALDIDNSRRVLTGLYDDAALAGDMLERIQDISSESSIDTSSFMSAAEGLAYIGVEGSEAESILRNVGYAIVGTGGSGEDLERVNSALSNMVNLGQINRQELNQLSNAGVPVFEGLATHLGVTVEEMNKMVSDGAVSLDDVLSVMEHGTGEYFGLVIDSASEVEQGIGATWQKIKNNISDSIGFGIEGSSAFDALAPMLDRIGDRILGIIENIKGLDFSSWSSFTDSLGDTGGVFDSIKNSLVTLQPAFISVRDVLPAIGAAAVKLGSGALRVLSTVLKFLADNVDTIIRFLPVMLAGYAAWRVASSALAASQTRLMLAQAAMAPVFLASNIARLAAVRAEGRLMAAQARTTGTTAANTTVTGANTTATTANTTAQNRGILARGRAAVAMVAQRVAMVAGTVATWAATAATSALGVAMAIATSPITLIVVAIAALVAGLVWFFTQTEIGQNIWDSLVEAFRTGWEWVKNAFQAAWDFIQPIFTGIWETIQRVGEVFVTVVQAYFVAYWNILSTAISFVWNSIIKPVWEAMQVALQALGDFFVWVWTGLIRPAWDALGAGISWVWESVIRPAWDALTAALGAVGDFFSWVWNSVIKPVWDAVGAGIRAVYDSVIQPAFDALKSGLESVGNFFDTIGDGIRAAWDKLKEYVASPINFVINTVWNDGLRVAWNTIAGFLPGLPEADRLRPVSFATGGAVYGPGTATSDSIPARLSRGEHVFTAAEVEAMGGQAAVYNFRKMVGKGVYPYGHSGANMPGFRDGGAVDDSPGAGIRLSPTPGEGGLKDIAILAKRLIHRIWPSITTIGGYRQDAYAEHPSGRALDVMVGVGNPIGDEVTSWALANDPVLPLIHAIWKQQMWYPGVDGGSMMADRGNPTQNHMDHPHLWYQSHAINPNVIPEGLVGHDGLTSADRSNFLRDKVSEVLDKAMNPILDGMSSVIGSPPPEWLGIPPKVATQTKDAAVDTAFDFVENIGDKLRDAYDMAKDVTATVGNFVGGLLRDEGGFIPTGLSIVRNETGRPERVLNESQWQAISGLVRELHFLTPEMKRWVDEGLVELERVANAAEEGFNAWANASEDQGRIGGPGDFLAQAGQQYGASLLDDALGLFGLDGIVGGSFNDSFTNLLNEAQLVVPALGPTDILDGDGRIVGSQLQQATTAAPVEPVEPAGPQSGTAQNVQVTLPEGKSAYSVEEVEGMLTKIDEDVDSIRIEVNGIKNQPAGVTDGVSLMV